MRADLISDSLAFVGVSQSLVRLIALALCTAPVCADAADAPLEMAPASSWVLDYADDSCALRRTFRAGEHAVDLELRQFAPGNSFQVIVASGTMSRRRNSLEVRFEPDAGWFKPRAMFARYDNDVEAVLYTDSLRPNSPSRADHEGEDASVPWPEQDRDARERSISGLSVTGGFEHDLVLQTGALHEAMTGMRTCLDELLTHWGIDAPAQRTLSRRAKAKDLAAWARRIQQVYPQRMVNARRNGFIRVRVIVGPDGMPTSCGVQVEMSHPSFEEAACGEIMRHARFEPALDAAGVPIASYYTTTIIYVIS